jgi:predicted GTPase
MKRGVIIGMADAGKTLFCTRFAEFLGLRDVQWVIERTDGRTESKRIALNRAESMTDDAFGRTRFLQSMCLEIPWRGRKRRLLITDCAGLTDDGVEEPGLRASIAQTLMMLVEADIILHVIDANQVGRRIEGSDSRKRTHGLSAIDSHIAELAGQKAGYMILANKMDMPGGKSGYRHLCAKFSKHKVLPMSALYATGLREVKQHVWRMA